jgi:UDP-N-acetylglucosamine 2-epimerase (non-hydrolysing)
MKIVSVVGARPQFIKYAPLSKELRRSHQEVLVHTGQHYDYNMNKVFFDELGIPQPDYNLGVGSGTHGYQTGEMLKGIEKIMIKEKPDLVMAYGDTNSTIASALSATKLHFRVGHIEAGLRSFDRSMPEEVNRVLTDHCSDYLFCPTQTAVDNLKREGITDGVYLTGDVMVDALDYNIKIAERLDILDRLKLTSKRYLVVTLHRAGNTDEIQKLESVADALTQLSILSETIVFPMHPRTEKLLKKCGLYDRLKEKVKLIEPLGYFEFLKLLNHAKKVLTDSGGIQKEAYILKVPCVTLRENTEWVETVESGWNVLAGANTEKIINLARDFKPGKRQPGIFGKGACQEIVKILGK